MNDRKPVQNEETHMSTATDWADRVAAAFEGPDGARAFAQLFTEDAVQHHHFFPTPHKGRAEIEAAETAMFAGFSDIEFTVDRVIDGGDGWACLVFTVAATNTADLTMPDGNVVPATGRRVVLPGTSVVHLTEDGLADEETRIQDGMQFMAQLGLLPS
jgi:hypothetical protein